MVGQPTMTVKEDGPDPEEQRDDQESGATVGMADSPFMFEHHEPGAGRDNAQLLINFDTSQATAWLRSAMSRDEQDTVRRIQHRFGYYFFGNCTVLGDTNAFMAASAGRDGMARKEFLHAIGAERERQHEERSGRGLFGSMRRNQNDGERVRT